jgi:hypothetical protein
VSSGLKLAAVPLSSARQMAARGLMNTSSYGMEPSFSIDRSLAST